MSLMRINDLSLLSVLRRVAHGGDEAEVPDLHASVRREQDVAGFEVPVDESS